MVSSLVTRVKADTPMITDKLTREKANEVI